MWWPTIDNQVEEKIRDCIPCQAVKSTPQAPVMEPTPLPSGAWQELALDICGPFPGGQHIVALVDYYSRWSKACIMKSITAGAVVECLDYKTDLI